MKRTFTLSLLLLAAFNAFSQEPRLERSILELQAGILGGWFVYESGITKSISLRFEGGTDIAGIELDGYFERWSHAVLTIEPRWYYNLDRRSQKSKNITNNSGNFFSLSTTYSPNYQSLRIQEYFDQEKITFMPKWGIRRNLFRKLHYELGIGLGYAIYPPERSRVEYDLHIRLGYTF